MSFPKYGYWCFLQRGSQQFLKKIYFSKDKMTVSVITSDPQLKNASARFSTVPLKIVVSHQNWHFYCRKHEIIRIKTFKHFWLYKALRVLQLQFISNVKSKTQQSINNSYRIIYMNINYFDVFTYRQLYWVNTIW